MAEPQWSIRSPGERALEPAEKSTRDREQERFEREVEEKLAEGFEIESQSDTKIVLVKPPRRVLGLTLPGGPTRAVVSTGQAWRISE
jgi:hypothetical protein